MTRERTPVRMTGLVAIETTYHGPTDTLGSRIIARSDGDAIARRAYGYDHALDGPDNHAAAAAAYANERKSAGRWPEHWRLIGGATRSGYVFVIDAEEKGS
jgi:hypothetical protein